MVMLAAAVALTSRRGQLCRAVNDVARRTSAGRGAAGAMAATAVPLFLIQAWDDVDLTPTYALRATLRQRQTDETGSTIGSAPSPATATACSTRRRSGGYPTSSGSLSAGPLRRPSRGPGVCPVNKRESAVGRELSACIAPCRTWTISRQANDRRAKANHLAVRHTMTANRRSRALTDAILRRRHRARRRAGAGATRGAGPLTRAQRGPLTTPSHDERRRPGTVRGSHSERKNASQPWCSTRRLSVHDKYSSNLVCQKCSRQPSAPSPSPALSGSHRPQ